METRYTCSLAYITAKLRLLSRRLYTYVRLILPHTWPLLRRSFIRTADCTELSSTSYNISSNPQIIYICGHTHTLPPVKLHTANLAVLAPPFTAL